MIVQQDLRDQIIIYHMGISITVSHLTDGEGKGNILIFATKRVANHSEDDIVQLVCSGYPFADEVMIQQKELNESEE